MPREVTIMTKKNQNLIAVVSTIFTVSALLLSMAVDAQAQRRNEREVRDQLRNLAVRIDNFENTARFQMQSVSMNDDVVRSMSDEVRGLRSAVSNFQNNFDRKRENRADAEEVVYATRRVDSFLQTYPQNQVVERDWRSVRDTVDRIASNYGVVNRWDQNESTFGGNDPYSPPMSPSGSSAVSFVGISGTYELDRGRSDRIEDVVSDAGVTGGNADDLREKLTSPQQLAIEIRGQQVALATSNASPVRFTADGRDRTETNANGETIRLRATILGNTLTIASRGGDTDYTVTFISEDNGRVLKVTRRITTDYLDQTAFSDSIYTKTDSVARLGIDSGNVTTAGDDNGGWSDNDQTMSPANGQTGMNQQPNVRVKPGNYVIANGATVTGILDNEINTKVSQNNDRFRLTVQSPDEFRGAVIEGYISGIDRSGRVTGQPKLTFNFEKITLRNGQTYDFAGTLQNITDAQGRIVKVDNEGTAKGDSQTKETVKRGGIGAGAGAILGAIIGGAKGAAIGAAIGGGAGAGTVVLTGKEDVRLLPGSTLTIQAAAPANFGPR